MPNMSHCRFYNTLNDLRDCRVHMDDDPDDEDYGLSEEEERARKKLIKLCMEIAHNYAPEVE